MGYINRKLLTHRLHAAVVARHPLGKALRKISPQQIMVASMVMDTLHAEGVQVMKSV
jgi:hypothetical protein